MRGGSLEEKYNLELYNLYDEPDVATFIKFKRLERAGHIMCACESGVIKKIFKAQPEVKRKVGRQN